MSGLLINVSLKAVLLSFRINDNVPVDGGAGLQYFDKVATKFAGWTEQQFQDSGVWLPATARKGSFIARSRGAYALLCQYWCLRG